MCYDFRQLDGVPKEPMNWVSQYCPRLRSIRRCQWTQSSAIPYSLTNQDIFTRFLCESGETGSYGQWPQYNMSTSALLVNYHSIKSNFKSSVLSSRTRNVKKNTRMFHIRTKTYILRTICNITDDLLNASSEYHI